MFKNTVQNVLIGIFIFLTGSIVISLQKAQLAKINQPRIISLEQVRKELEQETLNLEILSKVPTFGFDNLIADWVFLNFLQYFGDEEARSLTGYSLSPEYFDVIINHDPNFLDIHYFLSTSVSIYAGMPERSVELMNKVLASISPLRPKAYYVWRNKAIDELLFLGNSKSSQKSFEQAAEWASFHSNPESQGVAEASRKTAEFLSKNPNSKKAQVNAWTMVFNYAVDNRVRQLAINKIRELGGQVTMTPEGSLNIYFPSED